MHRPAAALVFLLVAFAATAGRADACGAFKHSGAVSLAGTSGRAPLEIGDSTSIFAAPYLGRLGVEADTHGCRQFGQGLSIIAARRRAGTLPSVVVLALGANAPISRGQIDHALRLVGPTRILALVTARRSPASTGQMRAAARRYPSRVLLIDWVGLSAAHGGWFGGDGLHVNQTGAAAFASLIAKSVRPFAFPPVRRLRLPTTRRGAKRCGAVRQAGRRLEVLVLRGGRRISCRRARDLAGRPLLRPIVTWRTYAWRATRNGPWRWVYVRHDGRAVIATARRIGRPVHHM